MFRKSIREAAKTFHYRASKPSFPSNHAVAAFSTSSQYEAGSGRFFSAQSLLWFSLAIFASTGGALCETDQPQQSERTLPVISRQEVEKHNTPDKVWVTYGDGVYDVTKFIANHPGGKEKLMSVAGKDIAAQWSLYAHHKSSPLVHELLSEMKIGVLPLEDVVVAPKSTHTATYSNKPVYDCIIIGSGMSGLQCGWTLVNDHNVSKDKVLVLEAQDYVGGRVKQMKEFIRGTKVEVGAEFLHGERCYCCYCGGGCCCSHAAMLPC
jgi:cytochrome b involved in lipid metabolism